MDYIEEKKEFTPFTIIAVLAVIFLSIIPFVENYKYNDNHLNWLNHDYCKNLMSSTELGTVFMTEGGDNQVFGTLYFTYAEKLRPDLTPYDQKGNIFKRIYGDMRYIDYTTLLWRQQLVDTAIFNGQEPFYEDIRSLENPYLIPYWMGERPVYLTWERPNPSILGDYYYKRYGIMYKVQDIEYRLVDYLEIKQEITVDEAITLFETWLPNDLITDYAAYINALSDPEIQQTMYNTAVRTVDAEYVQAKIDAMVSAGYIEQVGNTLKFVEMYPEPHGLDEMDYFDDFLLRWHDAPNAQYWDFLSREIIVNYDYEMGEIYRNEVTKLEDLRLTETRPEILAEIDAQIEEKWRLAIEHYEDALFYAGDSISILHNVSVVYLNSTRLGPDGEDLKERAHELLTDALTLYPTSWNTYSIMFMHLVFNILEDPANEDIWIQEIYNWFDILKKQLVRYHEAAGEYSNHSQWVNFEGVEGLVQQMEANPYSSTLFFESQVSNMIETDPASVNSEIAQSVIFALYSRGIPFMYTDYTERADYYFETMVGAKSSEYAFQSWAYMIALNLSKYDLIYDIGKNLEAMGMSPNDYSYYLVMGQAAISLEDNAATKEYLNLYLETIELDYQAKIQNATTIQQVQAFLDEL